MNYYTNPKNYSVYIEEDGDDIWVSVHNGYCCPFDCIVGTVGDGLTDKERIETAFYDYFPAQYVKDNLEDNDSWQRVSVVAKDAVEIEDALEQAARTSW